MDLEGLTLAGLAALGVVNVISFFKPDLDSKVKFAASAIAAFVVIAFVPQDLGNQVLEQAKEALVIAFAASGLYKVASKAGGK